MRIKAIEYYERIYYNVKMKHQTDGHFNNLSSLI